MIWIVNQPKCGTGTLERSVLWGLDCELTDGGEFKDDMPKLDYKTRFHVCPAHNKTFFRTHSRLTSRMKEHVNGVMEAMGTKPERCVVMTAVRDPLLSIPSLFFEANKVKYCEGEQTKEEIVEAYEKFLKGSRGPPRQAETTAAVLRDFGVTDILGAMERLSEEGYAFFDQPDGDSPWAGCELLFLQIDYDVSNSNLDAGLGRAIEGLKLQSVPSREELCPKAVDNYHALVNHEIREEHIDRFAKRNPEMRDIITYYKNRRAAAEK